MPGVKWIDCFRLFWIVLVESCVFENKRHFQNLSPDHLQKESLSSSRGMSTMPRLVDLTTNCGASAAVILIISRQLEDLLRHSAFIDKLRRIFISPAAHWAENSLLIRGHFY